MAFKVTARTLLHLGAELISSDAVALYELIKNAFDAGSKEGVQIDIRILLPSWPGELLAKVDALSEEGRISQANTKDFEETRQILLDDLDSSAPGAQAWQEKVNAARNVRELKELAWKANSITIRDKGHGMSKRDLREVYLTIGTRCRLDQRLKQQQAHSYARPILGEKGIGRLSTMRLGQSLRVQTTRADEVHWNILDIDWSRFSHESEELLESIAVAPRTGGSKDDPSEQGTIIRITRLNANWNKDTVREFSQRDAAKFNNPFNRKSRYRVILRFNGEVIPIPEFDKLILNNAHAHVNAEFSVNGDEVKISGRVIYRLKEREQSFVIDGSHLVAIADVPPQSLRSLGPFLMEAFWFNRQLLRSRVDSGVEISQIVNQWSGGLMLFRDGFRVMPYGDASDDWLDLDRRALASQGYKVNRRQLIGRVEIASAYNPALTDQTNREGLRDSPEKAALVNLLKHILEVQLRRFLNEVDKEEKASLQLSFEALGERVRKEKLALRNNLRRLRRSRSETPEEMALFTEIDETVGSLEKMMADAQALADEFERGRSHYIHLAGLGLMVEFLAHELNRATQHALGTLASRPKGADSLPLDSVHTLEMQLRTLQKRLSVLYPASTSGRQRRESFDVAELAQQVLDGHAAECERHNIRTPLVKVLPRQQPVKAFMVKGMVIQVLENLLNNSLYWLKQERRFRRAFQPTLQIEIDAAARELRVTDNGPGVREEIADDVFKPFFTTKPPGEGKGLGLYISSEIAHYHEAELRLSDVHRIHRDCYNTFVLTLPE